MTDTPETNPNDDELDEHEDNQDGEQNNKSDSPSSLTAGLYTTPETRRRVRRRRRKGGLLRGVLKRFSVRRRASSILIGVIAIIVAAVIVYIALIFDTYSRIDSSITNLERIIDTMQSQSSTSFSQGDFERLLSGLDEVADTLGLSESRLILLRPLAGLNPTIAVSLQSLDIAVKLTTAAQDMVNGLQPAIFYLVAGESNANGVAQLSSGNRLVELLEIARNQFVSAQTELDNSKTLLDQLNVKNTSLDILRTTERITDFYHRIVSINGILLNSSDLLNVVLGLNGDKNYLVLGVNSDEIRPSGGFLSTWGWFKVRNGRITDYDYAASTIDNPHPPENSDDINLDIPRWWIQYRQPIYAAWDGSWYADFPSTASMAMSYYNAGNNINAPVDGVLSIDIYGFEYLLSVLGEITLPDYDAVVTAKNFRQLVYDIRDYAPGVEPHKAFVAAIYKQIMAEWQNASRDPARNAAILNVLIRAVQEKHVMIYLADEQLDNAIDLLGWSGSQQETNSTDYLMVVNSNLSNKATRSVTRTITYDVDLQDDFSANKRLTLNYDYAAEVAASDPAVNIANGPLDYLTMVQVYAPQDSTLSLFPDDITHPTQSDLNSLWLISSVFNVPHSDARRVQFTYNTPTSYIQFGTYGRYQLSIQKQPGTNADAVTVQVTLPPDTSLAESSPEPSAQFDLDRKIVEYQIALTTDQRIDLIFQYDNGVPTPVETTPES